MTDDPKTCNCPKHVAYRKYFDEHPNAGPVLLLPHPDERETWDPHPPPPNDLEGPMMPMYKEEDY